MTMCFACICMSYDHAQCCFCPEFKCHFLIILFETMLCYKIGIDIANVIHNDTVKYSKMGTISHCHQHHCLYHSQCTLHAAISCMHTVASQGRCLPPHPLHKSENTHSTGSHQSCCCQIRYGLLSSDG